MTLQWTHHVVSPKFCQFLTLIMTTATVMIRIKTEIFCLEAYINETLHDTLANNSEKGDWKYIYKKRKANSKSSFLTFLKI